MPFKSGTQKLISKGYIEAEGLRLSLKEYYQFMNASETDGLSSLVQQNPVAQQAYSPLREPLTKQEHSYVKNTLSKLSNSLQQLEAYVEVEENSNGIFIVISPLDGSSSIDGWMEKVSLARKEYFEDLSVETITFPNKAAKSDIQDLLYELPITVVEHHIDSYVIVGSREVVARMCKDANQICVQYQVTTVALEVSRKHVKFLLKFCNEKFQKLAGTDDVHNIFLNPDNETISVTANPNGHAEVKKLVELNDIAAEKTLPISPSAHKLLSSRRGAEKLIEIFGDLKALIVYDFEQTQISGDGQHNICFVSNSMEILKNVKKNVKKYVHEEKLVTSVAKIEVCSSKEWRDFVSKLCEEQFVFVTVLETSNTIIITGEQRACNSAMEQVHKFLNERTNVEKRVMVGQSEWFVIRYHFSDEVKGVNDQAKKNHVKVKWPTSDSAASSLPIVICGEHDTVESVETMVTMLIKNVCKKVSRIMGVPAVEHVLDSMADKVRLLESDEKVKVKIVFENVDSSKPESAVKVDGELPKLLCAGTSPSGSGVSVYTGDFAQNAPVGVVINFITSEPNPQVGYLSHFLESGGPKVVEDFQQKVSQFMDLQPGTIFKTCYGNLKCAKLLHCVLPSWKDRESTDNKEYFVEAALNDIIKTMAHCESVLIAPLTPTPLHYPVNVFVKLVMNAVTATNVQVVIYVEEPHHAREFQSAFISRNFQIHQKVHTESPLLAPTCKKDRPPATATAKTISSNLGSFITLVNGDLLEQQVCICTVRTCSYILAVEHPTLRRVYTLFL